MNSKRPQVEVRVPVGAYQAHDDLQFEILPVTLADFMSSQLRSCYTTFMSRDNGSKLFQLEFHCHRLITGLKKLEPTCSLPSSLELKAVLRKAIAGIVEPSVIRPNTEVQFVVVLFRTECGSYLRIHASLVPSMKLDQCTVNSVVVECQKGHRVNPAVKATSWYHERIPFEQVRSKIAKETILVGEHQGVPVLLEGLITNFFVITNDLEVWTADDDLVLSGSMRDLVLRACEELSITVVKKPIPLHFWRKYEAAFLTNARRLLEPVSTIEVPQFVRDGVSDVPGIITLQAESDAVDLVKKLRQRVTLIIESMSENIFRV